MAGFADSLTVGKEDLEAGLGGAQPQGALLLSCTPLGIACPFPQAAAGEEGSGFSCVYFWHRGAQLFDLRAEAEVTTLTWLQPHLPPCSALYFPSYPAPGALQLRTLSEVLTSVFTQFLPFPHSNVCYQHCLQ